MQGDSAASGLDWITGLAVGGFLLTAAPTPPAFPGRQLVPPRDSASGVQSYDRKTLADSLFLRQRTETQVKRRAVSPDSPLDSELSGIGW